MLRTLLLTALAALLTAAPAAAQDMSAAERTARTYMAHYSALELEAMAALLAEDVDFADPTALGDGIGPDGFAHHGRDETIELLQGFVDQFNPIELGFEWDYVFESNGRVVFMGHVNALYPTEAEGQVFRWRAEQVTVLTVRDGRIVRHIDYANYAGPQTGLVPAE